MLKHIILTINPGSTSTKIALFNNDEPIFTETIRHSVTDISKFEKVTDQYDFRKSIILKRLQENGIELKSIDCIVGRGGLVKPIASGVYRISDQMRYDLKANLLGEHASNLGGLLAHDIAVELPNTQAFIADPVVVDELEDIARYSGHPLIKRRSIFHALNQKAIARSYASDINKKYEELNLIVVHLGGGISVGAHKKGRVIDVNDALNGEGPFSPERSGGLNALSLAELCFSGEHSFKDIKKMIIGGGGLVAYLKCNDVKEIEDKISGGDDKALEVLNAMTYQVSKYIGSMAVVLKGDIDAIILTGGIAHSKSVTDHICESVDFLAPVKIYPGEDEMKSLAQNGLRVLTGEIIASEYEGL
ncbi:MAG: butyrate kinase [Spirochaetaceae bacterium]